MNLTGDQWGVMNETGSYPGQPWLWLYQLWYHVPGRGLIAVRPDGYVGFRCHATEAGQLAAWLARLGARQPETPAG